MARFLALYMGKADGPRPPQPAPETVAKGMAAWQTWMRDHASAIFETGGPLGETKKVSSAGISDIRNAVAAYVIVEAASQEAAAVMFVNHPHFTVFPGDSVEIMPVLPIPGQ